ncbi:hypothetical protein MDA_GLEAN10022089 [Myotis davidii]|uniref:Uncharacterized protein n=1 Tax=Myotis davidii TaxID=225400 RepID=L5MA31_MYODS|nr:hypothetical protein MDA_GLEAN10022089 [Myotis davidii]
MTQVDPCYYLPSPSSDKALPLLREAMGDQVLREMQWTEGSHIHLALSPAAQEVVLEDSVAITAHCGG